MRAVCGRSISIEVTQEDIDCGRPHVLTACPLVLALERRFAPSLCYVDYELFYLNGIFYLNGRYFRLSRRARLFIRRFHYGKRVYPARFRFRPVKPEGIL